MVGARRQILPPSALFHLVLDPTRSLVEQQVWLAIVADLRWFQDKLPHTPPMTKRAFRSENFFDCLKDFLIQRVEASEQPNHNTTNLHREIDRSEERKADNETYHAPK